jgi:O-antigen/teichoic acid export membrane protein
LVQLPHEPRRPAQKAFLTSTAYVCGLGAVAFATNFIAFVLIARVLTPAALGVYNLFVGLSAALLVFTFDHSSNALLRFGSEEHAVKGHVGVAVGTALAVTSASTVGVIVLLFTFANRLDSYFADGSSYVIPLVLFVATWPPFQSVRIVLQATGEFARYSLLPIVRSGVLLAAVIVSAWFVQADSPSPFIWAYVVSIPIAIILTLRWVPWTALLPLRPSVAHLKRVSPWLITMFVGSMTAYLLTWADSLILSIVSDTASVGIYAVANRLFYQLSVLPELLTVVLMPRLVARKASHDEAWIRRYSERVVPWLVLGAGLFAIAAMCAGYFGLESVYGSAYRSSRLPFMILTAAFPFLALSRFLGPVFGAYDLVWPLLVINVGCGAANILLNVILIPSLGIKGAAVATALCYGIQAFCVLAYLTRRLQITGQGTIFLGVPSVAFAVLIALLDSPAGVLLAAACSLGMWTVVAWWCRPRSDEDRDFINGVALPAPLARARRALLRA